MRALALVLLLGAAAALQTETDARPMAKVVKMLQDMDAQLAKEQKDDEEIYDAFACWCTSNDKAKTQAIADGEQHSLDLEASIQMLVGATSGVGTKIEQLKQEIEESEQAIATASAMRLKEAAEFHQSEKDNIQAIGGLKSAVQVLSKSNGDSVNLVQVRNLLSKHMNNPVMRNSPHRNVVLSLLQQTAGVADSTNAPPSGEIYGVLKAMKESFETGYEKSKGDEVKAKSDYEEMHGSKAKGLKLSEEQYQNKATQFADDTEKLASDRTDLKDTGEQLEADRYFLKDLKERCGNMDAEWDARSKVRMEEMKAVGEAIGILTDDEARDTFQRATSLLQLSMAMSKQEKEARQRASVLLRTVAARLQKPQLAALAVSIKDAGVFDKVKASIDEMVGTLKLDQAAEVKEKDRCTNALHENAMEMESRYRDKTDLETKIADLTELQERTTKEIKASKDEMLATRIAMKVAAENRKKENREFQNIIQDQRATQDLLQQALKKLEGFYNKAGFLQLGKPGGPDAGPPPPGGFKPYKKAGGAGGVMGMIRDIISEAEMEETDATATEQNAQTGYEEFVRDSNAEVKALLEKLADLTEQLAQCDADLTQANADLKALGQILEGLNGRKSDIDFECHHVLKYFEQRQAARTEEIDALNAAKALMSQAA